MGAVTFSLDKNLIQLLSKCLPLDIFIETGTFEGDTVDIVKPFFQHIYTIELSEKYFQKAAKRYKNASTVSVMRGDSAKLLPILYEKYATSSVVYWLDAHWCVAENTAGEKSQCPLLSEISAISSLNENSCIIIDDARLFIATPPKPHEASHWPTFDEIVLALQNLSKQHALMILNDNIIFYPKKISNQVSVYAQEHGIDWLHILNLSREHATRCKPSFKNRIKNNRIIRFFYLRLGKLNQHAPKPLRIPKNYYKEKPLSSFPKISIVTPSFNQGIFLEKTILSVVQQHYLNLEFIIQDGGSKDNSVEIIKKYQEKLHYSESKKDGGQSNAINLGFSHSTGDIMAYLNSDDLLLPGALNYVAHYFETHPNIDVIYGHRIVIDENDFEIGRWVLPPHSNKMLDWIDFVPQETLFWRRSIWNKAGGHINEYFQCALDWDLLLRFKKAGAKFARLPRFLGAFRVHSQQKTSAQIHEIGFKEMDILRLRIHNRSVSRLEIKRTMVFYLIKHVFYHALFRLKNILL